MCSRGAYKTMETRCFKKTGRDISLLGFGTLRLPPTDPGGQAATGHDAAQRMAGPAVEPPPVKQAVFCFFHCLL
jgi:hypothetical protein